MGGNIRLYAGLKMDTSALKFSGLAACILAIVAALACGPVAPPAQTPGGSQSTPMPTATSSNRLPPAVAESRLVELLDKVPLSLKERGIWFGDNERALELAGAPQPRSPDEVRALNEAEREGYLNALGNVVQAAGFGRFRGQLQEWNETFGLNYFGIARGDQGPEERHTYPMSWPTLKAISTQPRCGRCYWPLGTKVWRRQDLHIMPPRKASISSTIRRPDCP